MTNDKLMKGNQLARTDPLELSRRYYCNNEWKLTGSRPATTAGGAGGGGAADAGCCCCVCEGTAAF